jgi:hypothetical protein
MKYWLHFKPPKPSGTISRNYLGPLNSIVAKPASPDCQNNSKELSNARKNVRNNYNEKIYSYRWFQAAG